MISGWKINLYLLIFFRIYKSCDVKNANARFLKKTHRALFVEYNLTVLNTVIFSKKLMP